MIYIVYKTKNLINNKIYIGVHKQKSTKLDGYLGSGKWFRRSVKYYGEHNFKRETLFSYSNSKDAYNKESVIVTKEFINSKFTYNIKLGGKGGWDYVNSNLTIINKRIEILRSKFGNPCGQMHTKESNIKRLNTNTFRYGSPNAIIHNSKSRKKAEISRSERMKIKGISRNYYLNSTEAIDKAKITRVENTRLRSLSKYPELNNIVILKDRGDNIVMKDIMLNVSMYLFGKSKGTSCKNRLINLINGENFNHRSKWNGYKAYYESSSETIPSGSTLEV
jgi:hypothetical protein